MNAIDLTSYDVILVNSSAGKDSQAMLDYVVGLAREAGVLERVTVVHADLGRVEWQGTRELAAKQAAAYDVRFEVVRREKGDLLDQIEARGMFPDNKNRYCTSDQKRDQVAKLMTKLAGERAEATQGPCRILNCMGLRAAESPARGKKVAFEANKRATSGRRTVDNWLPIHSWTQDQVWATIKASGVPHHPAYDLGMPRLSCVFCVFSSRAALMLAGKHNPELLAKYVEVEAKIGHRFTKANSMAEIKAALDAGEQPGEVTTWEM
jgi:3'-phosphoadenosine 5'-phosphosulfate sulfotransferase (PAPS reductase)/FAD synthetase